MKKKILTLALSTALIISTLVGCGNEEVSQEPTTETTQEGELVELVRPNVMGLDATKYMNDIDYTNLVDINTLTMPTEESVKETITSYLEYYIVYKHLDGGTVAEDSIANISYVGKINDFAFEGGSAQNQYITIADSGYIDGFAESLVGHEAGETVTANLKFPDDYNQEILDENGNTVLTPFTYFDENGNEVELHGKDVTFEITINYICGDQILTFDELDDTAVSEMTDGYYTTIEDFVHGEIDFAYSELIAETEMTMWDNLVAKFEIKDGAAKDVQELYDNAYDYSVKYYEGLAQTYGMEDPIELFGYETQEEYEAYLVEESEYITKRGLIISYIIDKEGLRLSDEELSVRKNELAREYGFETFEEFAESYDASDMEEFIYYELASKTILNKNGLEYPEHEH